MKTIMTSSPKIVSIVEAIKNSTGYCLVTIRDRKIHTIIDSENLAPAENALLRYILKTTNSYVKLRNLIRDLNKSGGSSNE